MGGGGSGEWERGLSMIEKEMHVIKESRPRSQSNRRLTVDAGRGMVGCKQVRNDVSLGLGLRCWNVTPVTCG